MLVKILTQKDVLAMTKAQRSQKMDELQDKLCNLDYRTNEVSYNAIAYNLSLIESKVLYNEY